MHPIIIWGTRTRSTPLGQMTYVCPKCQQNCPHVVAKTQYIFTLFFVPSVYAMIYNRRSTRQKERAS